MKTAPNRAAIISSTFLQIDSDYVEIVFFSSKKDENLKVNDKELQWNCKLPNHDTTLLQRLQNNFLCQSMIVTTNNYQFDNCKAKKKLSAFFKKSQRICNFMPTENHEWNHIQWVYISKTLISTFKLTCAYPPSTLQVSLHLWQHCELWGRPAEHVN